MAKVMETFCELSIKLYAQINHLYNLEQEHGLPAITFLQQLLGKEQLLAVQQGNSYGPI